MNSLIKYTRHFDSPKNHQKTKPSPPNQNVIKKTIRHNIAGTSKKVTNARVKKLIGIKIFKDETKKSKEYINKNDKIIFFKQLFFLLV